MIDFLLEYGLFLAQTITIVIAIPILLGGVIAILSKGKSNQSDNITVENLNKKYGRHADIINREVLPKSEYKNRIKKEKLEQKNAKKKQRKDQSVAAKSRIFVLSFDGDLKATAVDSLSEEVSAVLSVARPEDQVLVRLESAGGMVHAYGLGASQLQRIRQRSIPLIVSVDKVAASGGYLMACVADQIIAAPFAIIGSIGVVAQIPNFNRLLKEHNIDFEQFTAGKHKRTVTMFGKNTKAGRDKLNEELQETHDLFQNFILESRKGLDMERLATGKHWYGSKALQLNLVDQIITGDDYLLSKSREFDIFELEYTIKKSLLKRIPLLASSKLNRLLQSFNHHNPY